MAVMMTGQRVGMVVRPPTGGGLLAVEGWGGRCAPRHLAQAGSNAGDIGRPADEIRRKLNSAGQPRERAPSRDEATRQGGHWFPVPST